MFDINGIQSSTNLFLRLEAGKSKLMKKLLGARAKLWISDCQASSCMSASAAGNFEFKLAVNEGVPVDGKTVYTVVFREHCEGSTSITNTSVVVTTTEKVLKREIGTLCKKTKFLKQDMRVSSVCLSRTNKDMFWSFVFFKTNGGEDKSVDVNLALREITPGQNWNHLTKTGTQSRPIHKCHVCKTTQKQDSNELVIPECDTKDEAALLLAEGIPWRNAAVALILDNERRKKME